MAETTFNESAGLPEYYLRSDDTEEDISKDVKDMLWSNSRAVADKLHQKNFADERALAAERDRLAKEKWRSEELRLQREQLNHAYQQQQAEVSRASPFSPGLDPLPAPKLAFLFSTSTKIGLWRSSIASTKR